MILIACLNDFLFISTLHLSSTDFLVPSQLSVTGGLFVKEEAAALCISLMAAVVRSPSRQLPWKRDETAAESSGPPSFLGFFFMLRLQFSVLESVLR